MQGSLGQKLFIPKPSTSMEKKGKVTGCFCGLPVLCCTLKLASTVLSVYSLEPGTKRFLLWSLVQGRDLCHWSHHCISGLWAGLKLFSQTVCKGWRYLYWAHRYNETTEKRAEKQTSGCFGLGPDAKVLSFHGGKTIQKKIIWSF